MTFEQFVKAGRYAPCLASEPTLCLWGWPKGLSGFIYPGEVFLEVIDGDADKGFRAEIGRECYESRNCFEVIWELYQFAIDEEYIKEERA